MSGRPNKEEMIRCLFCCFLFQFLFYLGYSQKDTVIFKARLIDTVTEHQIEYLSDHLALSILFVPTDSNAIIFSVAFYEPERFSKGFFQLNGLYNIYGHMARERFIYELVSTSPDMCVPSLIGDSIIPVK